MGDELFRKSALDKLASPERLDVLMQVTSPQGWTALWAIALVLAGAIAWSIFGSFPERIDGAGQLTQGGGLRPIVANGDGVLTRLDLAEGTMVTDGQIVGEIKANTIVETVKNAVQSYEAEQRNAAAADTEDQIAINGQEQTIKQLEVDIAGLGDQRKSKVDQVAQKKESLKLGYITQREVDQAESELRQIDNQTTAKQEAIRGQNANISLVRQRIRARDENVDNLRRQSEQAHTRASDLSNITSTAAGRVMEVTVRTGEQVHTGQEVARIEPTGSQFEAIVDVPTASGKRVTTGMEAQVSPAGIRREDFGYLKGTVTEVGEYAATEESMLIVLGSAARVKEVLAGGSKFEVHVKPEPANTPSGYAWSSGTGPPQKITGGLNTTVSVIVDRQAPIKEVLPFLKKAVGAS